MCVTFLTPVGGIILIESNFLYLYIYHKSIVYSILQGFFKYKIS